MTDDRILSELLRYRDDAEGRLDLEEVLGGGRRLVRRRRLAVGAATLVAVSAVAAPVIATGMATDRGTVAAQPTTTAQAAQPSAEPSDSAPPRSPHRVLKPGHKVRLPATGATLWLTRTGYCRTEADEVHDGELVKGLTDCRRVDDGNFGGWSRQGSGNAQGMTFSGLFQGKRTPAAVTFFDGKGNELQATILTAPGQKGWIAYYAATAASDDSQAWVQESGMRFTDDRGKVLEEVEPRPAPFPPAGPPR